MPTICNHLSALLLYFAVLYYSVKDVCKHHFQTSFNYNQLNQYNFGFKGQNGQSDVSLTIMLRVDYWTKNPDCPVPCTNNHCPSEPTPVDEAFTTWSANHFVGRELQFESTSSASSVSYLSKFKTHG